MPATSVLMRGTNAGVGSRESGVGSLDSIPDPRLPIRDSPAPAFAFCLLSFASRGPESRVRGPESLLPNSLLAPSDSRLSTPYHFLRPEHRPLGTNALIRPVPLAHHTDAAAQAHSERAAHAVLHRDQAG